ncbi:uncharacterized protein LOC111630681 [Centruroides sculpturatus]|uniref:uncharacterized protein LOC111630681 n=2 Tax=Centruroides sculpturatus TaxID=218467 RepID=UPI000C6DD743|nr:uncharacterized protein LOC111630681 [Centruroides sculpturatus]
MEYPDCYLCLLQETFRFLQYVGLSGIIPNRSCRHAKSKSFHERRIWQFFITVFHIIITVHMLTLIILYYGFKINVPHMQFIKKAHGQPGEIFSLTLSACCCYNASLLTMFNFWKDRKKATETISEMWNENSTRSNKEFKKIFLVQKIIYRVITPSLQIFCIFCMIFLIYRCYHIAIGYLGLYVTGFYIIIIFLACTQGLNLFIGQVTYFFVTTEIIRKKFSRIVHELRDLLNRKYDYEDFKSIQAEHNVICKMVIVLDGFFNKYIFLAYCLFLPAICFNTHFLIFSNSLGELALSMGYSNCLLVTTVLIITLTCEALTNESIRPRDVLHELALFELHSKIRLQLNLFMERINGFKVGFTCLEYFVVTGNTLSNIISFLATYLLMYVQFMKD